MHPLELSYKLSKRWTVWILLSGLVVSIIWGLIGRLDAGFPVQMNNVFLDAYLKFSASGKTAQDVVVVDIDDVSLSAAGQWPWPRYRMADLVQAVAKAKPSAIGLDIIFSEPDRTSLKNIQKTFKQDFGLDISFVGAPDGVTDNDGYFGHVLSGSGAVGARYFYFDHVSKAGTVVKQEFRFIGKTALLSLNDAPGILTNTPEIESQLLFNGFLNTQPDSDGMLRRVPLLIQHKGIIYPHLALATYMRSVGLDTATIDEGRLGPVIRVGDHSIPIDARGFALMRFNGKPHLYPAIPALEVLNGTFSDTSLRGKIVFIGSSAAGLNDLHGTIFDLQFPGLKTQAVIVENIRLNSFVREVSWAGSAVLLACIVAGLIVSMLFVYRRAPADLFLSTGALAIGVFLASACLFQFGGIFLSPAAPLWLLAFLFTLFTAARYALEQRKSYVWFRKLANARQVTMESMAAIAETRDPETGAHIKRTQFYVKAIAEKLRDSGMYSKTISQEFIDLLFVSAPLHDIGKVGVPDHILLKPGKLTAEEFELMKKHAEYGKNIIHSTAQKIEGDNFLRIAGEIASTHHEKWDGTGYPLGLSGQDIPLSGRIMAVADVYDALISRRCYKPPFTHAHSMELMLKSRGEIFDPAVFDAFLSIEPQIQQIASQYQDEHEMVVGDR